MNKQGVIEGRGPLGPQRDPRWAAGDLLKAVAIVGVLLIHASTSGYYTPIGSFSWFSSLFWGSISRASVPIFFMVSGALMLDPGRQVSLKKLWTRSIPRLLAALFFWAFAYQVYRLLFVSQVGLTPEGLWMAVQNLFSFQHEFHLYFLHIILLVYALLPATRLIVAHGDKRTLQYLLAVWALLAILYPTLRSVWPAPAAKAALERYSLNLTYCAVGYGILGFYVRKYAVSAKKWALLALAGFLMVFGGVTFFTWRTGTLAEGALSGSSPGVALLAVGLCGAASALLRDRPAPRWALLLSRASFCVYLVHVFFLYLFQRLGLTALAGPPVLFVPLTAAAMLAGSLAVWLVLSRIPGVRRWLI